VAVEEAEAEAEDAEEAVPVGAPADPPDARGAADE